MPVSLDVAVLVGSPRDLEKLQPLEEVFQRYGIRYWMKVASAHRSPQKVVALVQKAEEEGAGLLVAAAGLAAYLPGVVASRTVLPVIGLPLAAGSLGGLDALLSVVQMPRGVPVATVAIDQAVNAALLAAEILSLRNPSLKEKLLAERRLWEEEGAKG
ncbi:MAG: 5-(carboxyamino)imidazole ribonucleotide mutase [Bacillota bacterium]|nr:5-(carboxyamino)imidazole ribonucleotide mutase [Bacillota bacterium]